MSKKPVPMKTLSVHDSEMAYVDIGEGPPIVFLHGNPTSSFLWRNVIPHLSHLGRCLAPDLIGMGHSSKMPSGTYRFVEHVKYLDLWFEQLGLTEDVIIFGHDWGAALTFHRIARFPKQFSGLAYMEAMVQPRRWSDLPEERIPVFKNFRTEDGKQKVLQENIFVENLLFKMGVIRTLTEEEKQVYRSPYPDPLSRMPTLMWPREIPFDGDPADVDEMVAAYAEHMRTSELAKLYIDTTQGHALVGRNRDFCRTWKNQTEVQVEGKHFAQEDSPDEIGQAFAKFVEQVRNKT